MKMRKTKYVEYLTVYILNKLTWRLEKEMLAVQSSNPSPEYCMALAKAHHAVANLRRFY